MSTEWDSLFSPVGCPGDPSPMTSSTGSPPDPRSYDRRIQKVPPSTRQYRLVVDHRPGGILAVNLWAGSHGSRGPYIEQTLVDAWYCDAPLTIVRSLADVHELVAESIIQRRLPGID